MICALVLALSLAQQPVQDSDKASLDGIVTNSATGEPVKKVRVTLRGVAPVQLPGSTAGAPPGPRDVRTYSAESDVAGKFEFTKLDPGSYLLTARRGGFSDGQLATAKPGRPPEPIALGPGGKRSGVLVRITPYGVITGRVLDQDGDPLQGMQASVLSYSYTTRGRELVSRKSVNTDDTGTYRIYDLQPGKYFIKAGPQQLRGGLGQADAESSYAPMFYPGAPDSSTAAPIELGAGQQLRGFDLTLPKTRSATIRGTLNAPQGATGLQVGMMVLTENGSSSTSSGINDKDGKFVLYGVTKGPVYITGSYNFNAVRFSAKTLVQVGTEDINNVELRPSPPMEISGQIRVDGVAAPKFAQMRVRLNGPAQGGGSPDRIQDDGRFTIRNLEASTYQVQPSATRDEYLKSIAFGDTDITDTQLDLSSGVQPRAELQVVFGSDAAELSGDVKTTDGEPADGAIVVLIPTSGHKSLQFHKRSAANAAGHFTIPGIAPGEYKVLAFDSVDLNAVVYDPEFMRPYESLAKPVRLQSKDKSSVDLKLTMNVSPN